MIETSLGFRPALASTKLAITLVHEPGAVTPIFLPFRSATVLKLGIVFGLTPSTICGARPCSTKARRRWPLACMFSVCSKAPETTSALPPITRLQRARAAGEVDDRHVEPFGLEVAQRLGDRQRQVVQQVLAADGDRDLGLLERLRAREVRGASGRPLPASSNVRRCMKGLRGFAMAIAPTVPKRGRRAMAPQACRVNALVPAAQRTCPRCRGPLATCTGLS